MSIGMPPAKVVSPSHWELLGSRVIEANEKRVVLESSHRVAQNGVELRIDDDLLVDCFQRLEGQTDPGRINFRYVVALLLMRRKRLKFEESRAEGNGEVLILRCARTGARHEVINPGMTEDEMTDESASKPRSSATLAETRHWKYRLFFGLRFGQKCMLRPG
jgi:hypothetical protein